MCLYDLVADRQADARALVLVVGMEPPKQLEDRSVKLGLDADSVVFDGDRDIGTEIRFERTVRRISCRPPAVAATSTQGSGSGCILCH